MSITATATNVAGTAIHTVKVDEVQQSLREAGLSGAHVVHYECDSGADTTVWMNVRQTYGVSVITAEDGRTQTVCMVDDDHEPVSLNGKDIDLKESVNTFIECRARDIASEFLHGETRWTLAGNGWEGGTASEFATFCLTEGGAEDMLPAEPTKGEHRAGRIAFINRLRAEVESSLEDTYDPERHDAPEGE